jgi:hypothetical protein
LNLKNLNLDGLKWGNWYFQPEIWLFSAFSIFGIFSLKFGYSQPEILVILSLKILVILSLKFGYSQPEIWLFLA